MTAATNLRARMLGSVRYYVGGEGEPLLLLHGLAGSTGNWVELLPDLVQRYRVIALDLPGHGGSGPLPRGASTADFAAVAAAVLEAEESGPAVVAGHSFGGLVALRLAHSRPELVRGLLLVSPAGIRTSTRIVQAIALTTTTIRPGRFVAPLRHRYAERGWYRRAVFRPWFVSDAVVADAERDARPPRRAARAHGHEERGPRHDRRRPSPRPRRDLVPRRRRLGRARPAVAGRRCVPVRAPAGREAAGRRRLRPPRDRRAPGMPCLDALARARARPGSRPR